MTRYRIISGWSRLVIRACPMRSWASSWRVEGRENLPARPAVILSKHQSAWETMAFQLIFPPQVLVLKRELLWIPFFGWGLALMSPIAINRSRGMARAAHHRAPRTRAPGAGILGRGVSRGHARRARARSANTSPAAPGSRRQRRAGGAGCAQRRPALAAQCIPQAARHGDRAHRAADRRRQPRPARPSTSSPGHGSKSSKKRLPEPRLPHPARRPGSRIPLRAPAAAHPRHHGRRRRPEGLGAAARAVARHRRLRAREGALDPRQARRMVSGAASRCACAA